MTFDPVRSVSGPVSALMRDDIDTDQIIPKHFLKFVFTTGYAKYAFHDWRKDDAFDLPPRPILVSGRNFGCGSSREQAAWALRDYGFQAIIASSFGDIFFTNWIQNGRLPVVLGKEDCQSIAEAGEATIDLATQTVSWPGHTRSFPFEERSKRRLLLGLDEIGETLGHLDVIERYERERPGTYPKTRATGTPAPNI